MKRFFAVTGCSAFLALFLCARLVSVLNVYVVCAVSAACAVGLLAGGLVLMRKKKTLWKTLMTAAVSVLLFTGVWGFAEVRFEKNAALLSGRELPVELVIEDDGTVSASGTIVYTASAADGLFDGKITVYALNGLSVDAFDTVSATAVFYENETPTDYSRSNKIVGTCYLSEYVVTGHRNSFDSFLYGIRKTLSSVINRTVGENGDVVKALLYGDKSGLTDDKQDSLRGAGLSHIVAVSGFHVGMLMLFLTGLFSFVKPTWLKTVLYALALACFCALCGFTPSVLRAAVMVLLSLCLSGFGFRTDGINNLGFAVTVMMLCDPALSFHVGFLLSVSATFGLVCIYPKLRRAVRTFVFRKTGFLFGTGVGFVTDLIFMSLSCILCSFPFTALVFGRVTWVGAAAYLVVFPVVYWIFFTGLLTVCFGLMPGCETAAEAIGGLTARGAELFMKISDLFNVSWGVIDPLYLCISLAAGVLCFVIVNVGRRGTGKSGKKLRFVLPCVITLALLVFSTLAPSFFVTPAEGTVYVGYIDVGQGMGSVVYENGVAVVIDCGGSTKSGENMVEYLEKNNVKDIDFVILSHLHDDHTNGFEDLCEAFEIDEVLIPWTKGDEDVYQAVISAAAEEGAQVTVINGDITRTFGDTTINVLTKHFKENTSDLNENSMVVRTDVGQIRFLFTGDITNAAEKRLLESYTSSVLRATVVGVPHHGSKYSSCAEFVAAVSPSYAVISVGKNNYGHPNADVIARYETLAKTIRTDVVGDITFETDGTTLEMRTEK